MPDLHNSLLKQDIGHLRIIAELLGFELESSSVEEAREDLSASLLDPNLLAELIDSLPPEADSAITALVNAGGRLPWVTFTRQHGEIRDAGAGKRDREKLYQNPSSATETLYYRGLLARAFFDTEKGSQEFAYIPDDLLSILNSRGGSQSAPATENIDPLGRPATPGERGRELPANDSILDDATTLLAALRLGIEPPETTIPKNVILAILQSAKIINKKGMPQVEPIKQFLEASRADALSILSNAWAQSDSFNELKLMPGIVCEGEWTNQPQVTREFLMNLLDEIPKGKWWGLNAFIRDIKVKYADFQRPAGDYDSWFIKRISDGQYLRGFAYWDQVDGALIRYFITSILCWLGQVDLSVAEGASEPSAFRVTSSLEKQSPDEKGKISVSSNGKISIERTAPRVIRYQVSRFCEWEDDKKDTYQYHVTTNSLTKAKEQGLKPEHLLALLVKHTNNKVPPALVKALKRW
ncbi:MAG TPA: hypothetical protein DCX53_11900, partial [Anaerolineae bacterium]|nr:hypothetical protein [Anaerolineae bacterium]